MFYHSETHLRLASNKIIFLEKEYSGQIYNMLFASNNSLSEETFWIWSKNERLKDNEKCTT